MLNQRTRIAALSLIAALVVIISACGMNNISLLQSESPLASPLQAVSPLAGVAAQPFTLPLPSMKSGMGQVYGRVSPQSATARIFLSGDFYLAPVVYGEPEEEGDPSVPFISLNVGVDQVVDIKDENGQFAFYDVPPGEYGIVIYTPIKQFLFPDAVRGPLYLTVESGQSIDIGDVIIR